jgi:hypothetical protein
MSEEFSSHNKSGLTAQSFAKYGDKLLILAGEILKFERREMKAKQEIVTIEMMMARSRT